MRSARHDGATAHDRKDGRNNGEVRPRRGGESRGVVKREIKIKIKIKIT